MLSIIICSVLPERLRKISQNIDETIGVEYEIVTIDNREKCWSIARAYNEGARQAKYPNLFFVHEDVMFHSRNWGVIIENKLREPDCGVIGFAGSKVKLKCYSGWFHNNEWECTFLYQKKGNKTKLEACNVFLECPFEEVVTLDGLGLFVRKEVWNLYPFDEKLLIGFHCYDLDFSLQIAASKQYKNYVCCSHEVLVEHFSTGTYDQNWYRDTIRLHNLKWNKILPMKVHGLNLSKKKEKKNEEKYLNIFLRCLLDTNYPEKRTVLKEFLFYPFSWKHLGHCISNLYKYTK